MLPGQQYRLLFITGVIFHIPESQAHSQTILRDPAAKQD